MTDLRQLRQQHFESCAQKDSAVAEYNSLHRRAKGIKQNCIVPLEEKIKIIEVQIRKQQKLIS